MLLTTGRRHRRTIAASYLFIKPHRATDYIQWAALCPKNATISALSFPLANDPA